MQGQKEAINIDDLFNTYSYRLTENDMDQSTKAVAKIALHSEKQFFTYDY